MDGKDVKNLREALQLTQQQFSSLLGFSFVSVNRWENMHCEPQGLSLLLLQLLKESLEKNTVEEILESLHGIEIRNTVMLVKALTRLIGH